MKLIIYNWVFLDKSQFESLKRDFVMVVMQWQGVEPGSLDGHFADKVYL